MSKIPIILGAYSSVAVPKVQPAKSLMDSTRVDLSDNAPLDVRGVIHYVNTFDREVGVEVEGGVLALDVPIGCAIYLREERVKLRFLQAGDPVQITCSQSGGGLTAESICVNWTCLVPHRAS